MRRTLILAVALVAITVPAVSFGGGQKHWSESTDGRWQGSDDAGQLRADLSKYGRIGLRDENQRSRIELDPNFSGDDGPLINLQDGQGARVFAVFSNGRLTVGTIDPDGTIHTRPGAIVQDLP